MDFFCFFQLYSTMPHPRQPDSLQDSCIHFIANNEKLWLGTDFNYLAISCFEKLLEAVLKRLRDHCKPSIVWSDFLRSGFFGVRVNRVRYEPWGYLVLGRYCPSNERLILSDVETLFAKFLQCSMQLVDLDLSVGPRLKPYPEEMIHNLIDVCDLSNLQVLNMSRMRFCENSMAVLERKCPRLRELRLERCECVNDNTMTKLLKKDSDGYCTLSHIKVLDVRGTGISHRGVQHVLECIPTITHLHHLQVIPVALKLLHRSILTLPFSLELLETKPWNELADSIAEHVGAVPLD